MSWLENDLRNITALKEQIKLRQSELDSINTDLLKSKHHSLSFGYRKVLNYFAITKKYKKIGRIYLTVLLINCVSIWILVYPIFITDTITPLALIPFVSTLIPALSATRSIRRILKTAPLLETYSKVRDSFKELEAQLVVRQHDLEYNKLDITSRSFIYRADVYVKSKAETIYISNLHTYKNLNDPDFQKALAYLKSLASAPNKSFDWLVKSYLTFYAIFYFRDKQFEDEFSYRVEAKLKAKFDVFAEVYLSQIYGIDLETHKSFYKQRQEYITNLADRMTIYRIDEIKASSHDYINTDPTTASHLESLVTTYNRKSRRMEERSPSTHIQDNGLNSISTDFREEVSNRLTSFDQEINKLTY